MNGHFDFERIWEDKRRMRQRLAAAPIVEKLRLLDALRERAIAIRGAMTRKSAIVQEQPATYGRGQRKTE